MRCHSGKPLSFTALLNKRADTTRKTLTVNRNHKFRSMFALCLFFFALLFFSLPSYAAESQKIRVGYYEDGSYMSRSSNGNYTGFNFEYLQEISKYTHWDYEVVDALSWENAFSMLKSGEIDLLPCLYYTKERSEEFLFPETPMCTIYSTLNVRADDTRYDYEDYDSFQGMRVGVIRESIDASCFEKYCEEHDIHTQIIPYAKTEDLLAALEDQTLDGIAISYLGKSNTFRIISQFAPQPVYIALSANSTDLLPELNAALNKVKLKDPYYEIKMFEKYFSYTASQKPVFTREESQFIESSPPIKVSYATDWPPLEYQEPGSKKFSGFAADLFQNISEASGLKFDYTAKPDYSLVLDGLRDGSVDVASSIADDYLWTSQNRVNATSYYLQTPIAIVSADSREDTVIALPTGYLMSQKIAEDNPDKKIVYYSTTQECFDALLDGEANRTYSNTYVADYLLSKPRYGHFSVTTMTNYTTEISIGISKNADPMLLTVLDKCIQYISDETINDLMLKNTLSVHTITWKDLLNQYPVQSMCALFTIFLLVILILGYALIMKSKHHKRIQKIMYLDSLTDIWNLSKFRLEAKKLLDSGKNVPYAFVYLDINQFKTINDNFGFAEGDSLLRSFADILCGNITEGEYCARVAADQFVLLLRYTGWEELTDRTERIDRVMNGLLEQQNKDYRVILVFGVYLTEDGDARDISMMLDLANYARRSAKTTHKSLTVKYDENMRKNALKEQELTNLMHTALENGEFVPYFQAKFNMKTGEIAGCEALVRWVSPDGGIQMPGSFLPFFEKNGFITEVDLYIFEEVCKTIHGWMEQGRPVKPVSCNFSRMHFRNDHFPQTLTRIADKFCVPHHYLELEITETVVMEDQERVLDQFSKLKALGFLISIDDFGSGYSSLGMLQHMSVDVVKLDRSFLQADFATDREQAIIRGIISVVKELDISLICEGVETREQADMLMDLGCFTAQGFYYARPVPLKEFEEMLAQSRRP